MLKLFRKLGGPVVLMAAVAGCAGMDTIRFLNASAVPTNTDIPFRSGIQYSAPQGFCATDAQTYQEEARGFGVFVTCFGAYDRSRLLTVAHYPPTQDRGWHRCPRRRDRIVRKLGHRTTYSIYGQGRDPWCREFSVFC